MGFKLVTIAAAGTDSGSETTGVAAEVFVGLQTDADLTTSDLTFEVAYEAADTFVPLKIEAGTAYTITGATASSYYALDYTKFLGVKYIKVIAGTTQVAETTITLHHRIIK